MCIPSKDVLLYYVGSGLSGECHGRFTTVHRGIWNRKNDNQMPIVRKALKPEFSVPYSQVSHVHILILIERNLVCIYLFVFVCIEISCVGAEGNVLEV